MEDMNIECEPRLVSKVVNILNLQEESPQFSQQNSTHTSTTSIASTDEKVVYRNERLKIQSEEGGNEKYNKAVQVKDCGYAWVVLGAMVLSNVLTAGYIKSFGIIYNSVIVQFPDTSGAEAGLMMGLLVGCRAILAPLAGALGVKFGSRISLILGTILCFVGLISSYFCTSVWQLSLTLGAMIGMGVCLIESIQVVVLSNYFEQKLSIANGFRVSGNPIGGMIYPFILYLLADELGFQALRIILGSIFLHILICAFLIRSPKVHRKIQILGTLKDFKVEASKQKEIYKILNNLTPNPPKKSERKSFEFHYLKNCVYWLFIISSIAITFSLPMVIYYIPIYGKSFGLSSGQISLLLSSQSLMDTILRIVIGFISDKNLYKKVHGFIFCLFVGSIGAFLIPFCSQQWQIYLAMLLFSTGSAGYYAFLNVVLTEQFGKTSIATTWGFARMVQGIFNFINPSLIGAIIDATDSFIAAFIFMGGGMLVSGILFLLEPLVIKITKSPIVIT
ncbi:UNVERIFIED_CONTAM: hypothetical protein RMT77_011683 [Armadillidium vulgare]